MDVIVDGKHGDVRCHHKFVCIFLLYGSVFLKIMSRNDAKLIKLAMFQKM